MKIIRKINQFILRRSYIFYFLIFIIAFLIFGCLQSAPGFLDPDSFYHAKIVQLISQGNLVEDFPWLPLTTLSEHYIDQHLLYHALVIPFVWLLGSLVGLKFSAIVFASLFLLAFYWLLQRVNKHVHPVVNLIFTLFLLLCQPLVFRLNLAKAPSLSLIFLLIGFYFIIQRKYWYLFLFSFIYVYLYGGWPLILVVLFLYIIVSGLANYWEGRGYKFKNLLISFLNRNHLKLIGSCLSGLAMGVIFNPYFPQNLKFYWQQLVEIGIVNYQGVVRVGSEWYPYGFKNLFLDTSVLAMLLLVAVVLFILNYQKQSRLAWTTLVLTVFFFVITLKSQRYVEYFIPLAVLFSAVSLGPYLKNKDLKKYWRSFVKLYNRRTIIVTFVGIFWLLGLTVVISRDWIDNWQYYHLAVRPFNQFDGAISWLENNVPSETIIFHSDWDDFPQLFYYNDSNYYVAGLDPTFLYRADPNLYQRFEEITLGQVNKNLAWEIENSFQAQYIFVEILGHEALVKNLLADPNIKLIYQDKEAKIFKIK